MERQIPLWRTPKTQGITQVPVTDGPEFAWQHNQISVDFILTYLWNSKRKEKTKIHPKNLNCGSQQ